MAYSVRGSKHWKAKKAKHYKSEACKAEKRIRESDKTEYKVVK